MKVVSIEIQGFHNADNVKYTFTGNDYINGANGAGKSTIIQALQLVLFGNIAGTKRGSNEALFEHVSGDLAVIKVTLDDNDSPVTITRMISKVGSKINNQLSINPENFNIKNLMSDMELPVFDFKEFTGMTANKLKDWFIEFLPTADFTVDWERVLVDTVHKAGIESILDEKLLPDTLSTIKSYNLSGVDEVRKVNEYVKSLLTFTKSEFNRLQSTMQSLVFYEDFTSQQTIAEMQLEMTELENSIKAYNAAVSTKAHNDALKASIETIPDFDPTVYDEELRSLNEKFILADAELVDAERNLSKLDEAIAFKTRVVTGNGKCPYTNSDCNSIKQLIKEYKEDIDAYNHTRSEIVKNIQNLKTQITQINDRKSTITQYQIKGNQERSQIAYWKSLLVPEDDIPEIDLAETEEKINKLRDNIIKATANQQYNSLIDKFNADKSKISQTIAILKLWDTLTSVNGLQATSVTDPFAILVNSMSDTIESLLGDNTSIKFNSVGKSNSFSFGIIRNSKYIPFDLLSSGEKCIFTLSLLLALIRNSSSPLKLLVADDIIDHLDDTNANSLFNKMSKIDDVQIILVGAKKISNNPMNIIEVKSNKEIESL